ncbi:MAG: hypothetical protein [Inoviridae sp.]|nr:MAG: hypothetical protein [Inoviridae sp.]
MIIPKTIIPMKTVIIPLPTASIVVSTPLIAVTIAALSGAAIAILVKPPPRPRTPRRFKPTLPRLSTTTLFSITFPFLVTTSQDYIMYLSKRPSEKDNQKQRGTNRICIIFRYC